MRIGAWSEGEGSTFDMVEAVADVGVEGDGDVGLPDRAGEVDETGFVDCD